MAFRSLAAICLLALAEPAFAADAAPEVLPAPAWALEFGISYASLTSFDGATFSARHQVNEHAAWRYGISVSSRHVQDETSTEQQAPAIDTDHREYLSDGFSAGVSLTRLTFPTPAAVVRPYFGAGLKAGWRSNRSKNESVGRDPNGVVLGNNTFEIRSQGPWYQGSALFGLEWHVSSTFLLHAEYGQALWYGIDHTTDERNYTLGSSSSRRRDVGTRRSWDLVSTGANAGVSVFF